MAQLFYDPDKPFDENLVAGPQLESTTYQAPATPPSHTVLGKPVHTSFGIASGAAVATSEAAKAAFDRGFDIVTFKTQRSVPFEVNPFPNIVRIDIDKPVALEQSKQGLTMLENWDGDPTTFNIVNSFGNASKGPDVWLPELKKAVGYAHEGQILLASVVGTIQEGFSEEDYWQDFANTAALANVDDIAGIELNLSCPNVAGEGVVCYTHEAVVEICKRTKQSIGNTPLLAKIGYFDKDQQELLEKIIADITPYVQGISAINTIPSAIYKKDGTQALPGTGRLIAGLSGGTIKWAGLDMVRRLDTLRKNKGYKYEIFGMGGVMKPADYQEYRDAGADCVQSVAGIIWNPNLAIEIKASLDL